MFYNSDGSAITPGNLSITGGKILRKPDLTAADGVTTSEAGFAPFFGTSAATPHAAAIAALVWSYNRALTASQVEAVLTNSCIKIMGAPGWDRNSGYGILMANLALSNTPPPTITSSHLAFTTQPGGGPAGTAWAIQPVVTLQDGSGHVVTGTPQNVTLALQNGGLGATLNGNVTVATVAGVATFAGLSINQPGSGYTLTATGNTVDTTPGTVVSSGFNVTATVSSGPPLSLAFSGGVILLTWPTIPARFNLQSSRKLGPSAAWTTVSPSVVAGGENIVAIIPSEAQQFFRLGE
jgi:subtilisin family serine protease